MQVVKDEWKFNNADIYIYPNVGLYDISTVVHALFKLHNVPKHCQVHRHYTGYTHPSGPLCKYTAISVHRGYI